MTDHATSRERKKWTLMFYLASDNPLAPSTVSQLKALKDAGFHKDVNVIARFDPYTEDSPPHILDVNNVYKLKFPGQSRPGFPANDPYVRNLAADKLWDKETRRELATCLGKQKDSNGQSLKYDPPLLPEEMLDEQDPVSSLRSFLQFCQTAYPADNYMLFIMGHGLVVGDEYFLLDEHTDPINGTNGNGTQPQPDAENEETPQVTELKRKFLKLKDLGKEVQDFCSTLGDESKLQLIGFHSCSMSAIEVAYELRGTANFMLASEGPAFVGSWPYKQIILRIFNDVSAHEENVNRGRGNDARRVTAAAAAQPGITVETRVETDLEETSNGDRDIPPSPDSVIADACRRIFSYCLFNSYDFQLAGYSFDMSLTDLRKLRTEDDPVKTLASELKDAMSNPMVRDLVLLAHLESQSYWEEKYTDLADFCFCLRKRCQLYLNSRETGLASNSTVGSLEKLAEECSAVIKFITGRDLLKEETTGNIGNGNGTSDNNEDRLVMHSGFAGPSYQYSKGLSVFFPWSEPANPGFWKMYEEYLFKDTGWGEFLREYWKRTMRSAHFSKDEMGGETQPSDDQRLLDRITGIIYNAQGQLKAGPWDRTGKGGANDSSGGDCACPSIKNHPRVTRPHSKKESPYKVPAKVPMSRTFYRTFQLFEHEE